MGFFKSWLKNKKKEKNLEERFEEFQDSILLEEDKKSSSMVEHYTMERLDQIAEVVREIEEEKAEYRVVTAYLNDIYMIGGLPPKVKADVEEVAANIVNLERARQEFLHMEKKISDVQYTAIQQEEKEVPGIIRRLRSNETYQETLDKDMKYLIRERDEWLFYKEELLIEEKKLQNGIRLATGLGILSAAFMLIYQMMLEVRMDLAWTMYLFVLVAVVCTLSIKIMNAQKAYRRASRNTDRAIQLLNTVKLKYINVTNAIDYCREKFHVCNAEEFNHIWEAYLEAVKQREKFEINNDDLRYYNNRLVRMLSEYQLYDAKVWVPQAEALVDHKEMVEITHRLNERRQKIRARIEKSTELVKGYITDIEMFESGLGPEMVKKVREVMETVEKLGVVY